MSTINISSLFAAGLTQALDQPEVIVAEVAISLLMMLQGRAAALRMAPALPAGLLAGIALADAAAFDSLPVLLAATLLVALLTALARLSPWWLPFGAITLAGIAVGHIAIAENGFLIPPLTMLAGVVAGVTALVGAVGLVGLAVHKVLPEHLASIAIRVAASWCAAIVLMLGAFMLTR